MAQELSERQQRAAERILEDEGLTEDLTDTAARALVTWASEQASALAGDTDRSDEQLGEALKELRKAVRTAAASGEEDPATLIAQVQKALAQVINPATPAPQSASTLSSDEHAAQSADSSTSVSQGATDTTADAHPKMAEPAADSAADEKESSATSEHALATQPTLSEEHPAVKPKPARPPKPVRPPKPATKPKPKPPTANTPTDQGSAESTQPLHTADPPPKSADQPHAAPEEHLNSEEQYARWLQNIENDDQE